MELLRVLLQQLDKVELVVVVLDVGLIKHAVPGFSVFHKYLAPERKLTNYYWYIDQ